MSDDPIEVANKIERELGPVYNFLGAVTRVARFTRAALRSWIVQEFGIKGDAEIVSQEVSAIVAEHKLLPASPREHGVKILSEIKGIKKAKASAILDRFESLEAVAAATTEELAEVRGISHELAEKIVSHLSRFKLRYREIG